MFQFPAFASYPYVFRIRYLLTMLGNLSRTSARLKFSKHQGGLPHSEIHGSKLIRSSPRLFAAYHVLLRLCMPRHPPNALNSLLRSHCLCSSSVGFGRTFPSRLRSKGCQIGPFGQNSICRESHSIPNDKERNNGYGYLLQPQH